MELLPFSKYLLNVFSVLEILNWRSRALPWWARHTSSLLSWRVHSCGSKIKVQTSEFIKILHHYSQLCFAKVFYNNDECFLLFLHLLVGSWNPCLGYLWYTVFLCRPRRLGSVGGNSQALTPEALGRGSPSAPLCTSCVWTLCLYL